jgi:hypothetical protein
MGKDCSWRRGGRRVWAIARALPGWGLSPGPTATLALAYLLVSTTTVFPVLDWIVSPPVAGDVTFPCAGHGCGCDTAADCRNGCCCFPNNQEPTPYKGACITSSGCHGAMPKLVCDSGRLHLLDKPILLSLPQCSSGFRPASIFPPTSASLKPPDSVPRRHAPRPGSSRNST